VDDIYLFNLIKQNNLIKQKMGDLNKTTTNFLNMTNDYSIHKSTDTVASTVSWNNKIEQNIKEIGEKSKAYKIMHIQESRKISLTYRRLMIAGIALGPISGLLSAIGAILHPCAPVNMPIISTCIAFISGFVIAVTKYGKFEEKSSYHKIAASKYTSLESNIRRQLVLRQEDRINAVPYLEYVGSNFDELFSISPLIDRKIYQNYVKIARVNGLVIPDEYGLTITVAEDYQRAKFNEIKNVSLINVNNIEITDKEEITDNIEIINTKKLSLEEGVLKGTKEIKRNGPLTYFPEINKYSDGRMEYEMERMMGLK
jgi:hypothetical protein